MAAGVRLLRPRRLRDEERGDGHEARQPGEAHRRPKLSQLRSPPISPVLATRLADAFFEELAISECGLVAVEELRSAAAIGEALRDAADEDADEDLLARVTFDDGAAFVTVRDAERRIALRVHFE